MIKKTTSSKPFAINNIGFVKALFIAFLITVGAYTSRCAELTSFNWSSSDTIAEDTTIITFTYQIVTASPAMVLYASLPTAINTVWILLDSVKVTINGTPATVNTSLSVASGRNLRVILSDPSLATSGSNIVVSAYAINSAGIGSYSWNFIRTANSDGSVVDQVTNPKAFKLIPPVPENLPPNEASNITGSSFTMTWNTIDYAYAYIIEVSTNNIFTAYVTGYNNTHVGAINSIEVTGLSPNTTYYFRIRAYNTTGTSDYSPYRVATTTKANQTITFDALPSKVYGAANFDLTATATSGLTVSFGSSNTDVATISGTQVQIVGAGTATITASQTGNATYNAAPNVLRDLVVTPLELAISGLTANNKVYDALTTASVSDYGTLTGIVGLDVVTLNTDSAMAAFADKLVGNAKVVTVSGLALAGTDSANYTIGDQTATADITIRALSLQRIQVNDKVYNGNTDATVSNFGILINIASGDAVNVATNAAIAVFADKNVADSTEILVSGISLTGADKDNYILDSIYTPYATISKKTLTVTANDDFRENIPGPYSGGNGVIYSGFIVGENESVLSGTLSYGGTSQGADNVGVYTIIPQGLAAQNYEIVYVNGTLTIDFVGINDDVLLVPEAYPNPFSNTINIKNAEMVSQIRISNLVGQEVIHYINDGSAQISISADNLNQGIYIMIVETMDGKHLTTKIVKK
jgi:hypothetical protein